MAVSAAERRFLLDQVDRIAQGDLIRLWSTAEQLADGDFFDFVMAGFPDIASTYYELAGQIAANWFEEAIPLRNFTPQPAELLPTERLVESAKWALGGDGVQARDRLSGTLQRAVYDGARDTTAVNAEATGSRWIRVARATACEFCKLLATRTDENYTYRSKEAALGVVGRSVNLSDADRRAIASGQMTRAEALARRDRMSTAYQIGRRKGQARSRQLRGTRAFGAKYHDFCHCTAKEIPAGVDALELLAQDDPQSAALVAQWTEEYEKAVANAGGTNTKQVLSQWRKQSAASTQDPVFDRQVLDNAQTVDVVGQYINGKHGIKVDQLIDSPMAQGIPIDTSIARGADVLSAARAAKPFYVDARTAREFGQAIDDVFTDLPFLELDEFKADFYPSGNPLSSVAHAGQRVGPEQGSGARSLVINQMADAEGEAPGSAYERYRKAISADSYDNRYKAEAIKRPAYSVGIHEMGHVIHFNGGPPRDVSDDCLRALREHVMKTPEARALKDQILRDKPGAFERLAGGRLELMPEYQDLELQWFRDNLVSAYSFRDGDRSTGRPDEYEALAEAYTDVKLRGDEAEVASKIIYDVMVKAARKNKTAR